MVLSSWFELSPTLVIVSTLGVNNWSPICMQGLQLRTSYFPRCLRQETSAVIYPPTHAIVHLSIHPIIHPRRTFPYPYSIGWKKM